MAATRFPALSLLDLKVGVRMLARYPWLTAAGTVAIAVAIALGTVYFEAVDKFRNPRLPIEEADRVVSLRNWDVREHREEGRLLNDFATWRTELRTVEDVGAAITFERNLRTNDGQIEPAVGAEITANAFRLMGTAPLMGRALTERDEDAGAPPVVVIGHRLWQSRFDGDPGVVGMPVRLGTVDATIVGVMPEGFRFPRSHDLWTPLRLDGATLDPRTGPQVSVFGRLAPGSSLDDAQAELNVIGARMSAGNPATHEHLRPHVTAYARPLEESGERQMIRNIMYAVNTIFLLLLAIMATNVATLVFARTATRSWEITVRSALGASRGRIIGQLFSEALVLAGAGAVVGLLLAKLALRFGIAAFDTGGELPFWIDASLSWRTVLYVAGLTLFGASIVGILPALRVTRVNIQDALRNEAAGRAGLRFGGFWTTVIILQVAVPVALIPLAAGGVFEANRFSQRAEGIGAENYLMAEVSMDREDYMLDSASRAARTRQAVTELARRLRAEPGVGAVAFSDRLPVEDQFKYRIEVDTVQGAPTTGLRVSTLVQVSDGFFDAYGTSVIAGRDFQPLDFEAGLSHVMIVNEAFVQNVLGGRSAIGHRVKILGGEIDSYAGDTWYEIVGVVRNFGWQLPRPEEQSAMYRPSLPVVGHAGQMALRVKDPAEFTNRLRAIAAEVDPMIRLTSVQPLTMAGGGEAKGNWVLTSVVWFVGFMVLLLSAMGIHALMAFTVARRTREIGIRAALGASRTRIVGGIFSRAFLQIGAGLLVGSAIAAAGGLGSTRDVLILLGANSIMLVVGLIACTAPLRRALSVNPTEALRAEG